MITNSAYPATAAAATFQITSNFRTGACSSPTAPSKFNKINKRRYFGGSLASFTRCTYAKRWCFYPVSPRLAAGSVVIETTTSASSQQQEEETSSSNSSSVVRRLILLRHAESSWDNRSLRDHDRPLSKNGQEDTIKISQKLQLLGWIPQLILSSDSRRTRETLNIMQKEVRGFLEAEVHFLSSFYSVAAMDGQTAGHLQQAISEYSTDQIFTIMCMGHNKGWEEAASMFSGVSVELKTCNAALLEAAGKSWEEAFALSGIGGWKLHGIVKPDGTV